MPTEPQPEPVPPVPPESGPAPQPEPSATMLTLRLSGTVTPEVWNRLGIKLLPKLRSGSDLKLGVDFSVKINAQYASNTEAELRQIIQELGLEGQIMVETR